MQNVAVQVFFVLSGYLIAGTLVRNQGAGFGSYLVDRAARIYSGLLPALCAVWFFDSIHARLGAPELSSMLTLGTAIGNVFMFQNWQGSFKGWLAVPALGSNGPLWTVAIEWWIYVFVGALYFLSRSRRPWVTVALAAVAAPMPMRYLFHDVQTGVGTGLFSLWLMGFAAFFLQRREVLGRFSAGVTALAGAATVAWYWHRLSPGNEYAPDLYPALALAFAFSVAVAKRVPDGYVPNSLRRMIRIVARYSYTLYLIHYPFVYLISKTVATHPVMGAGIAFSAANVIALALAFPTEMKHKALASWLKALLGLADMRQGALAARAASFREQGAQERFPGNDK